MDHKDEKCATAILEFSRWWTRDDKCRANSAVVIGELANLQQRVQQGLLSRAYTLDQSRLPHIDLRGDEYKWNQLHGKRIRIGDRKSWTVRSVRDGKGTAVMLNCGERCHMTMAFILTTPTGKTATFGEVWSVVKKSL